MNIDDFYVVFVHYNEFDKLEKMRNCVLSAFPNCNVSFVDVNTADNLFLNGLSVNDFYEFSGYYFGYLEVESKLKLGSKARVYFINSTVLSGYYCFKLFLVCLRSKIPFMQNSIFGFKQNRNGYDFVGTNFFVLDLVKRSPRFEFFPPSFLENKSSITLDFLRKLHVGDEFLYRKRVHDWLFPQRIFSGWYKSNPWNRLSESEEKRKLLTIYLEHQLLVNNYSYSSYDFSNLPVKFLIFYKFIDLLNRYACKVLSRSRFFIKIKLRSLK